MFYTPDLLNRRCMLIAYVCTGTISLKEIDKYTYASSSAFIAGFCLLGNLCVVNGIKVRRLKCTLIISVVIKRCICNDIL